VPTVSIHAEGDISLEAPHGELRLVARRMTTHVETDALREVQGRVVDKVTGPVTVASEARLAFKGGEVAMVAGGGLHAHAGGTHTLTGGLVTLNPAGAPAPEVAAAVPPAGPSAWGPRPVPGPGPRRSTEDPKTPTQRDLAQRAQLTAMTVDAPTAWIAARVVLGGRPVPDVPLRITAPGGAIHEVRTDATGEVRLDGVPMGECSVCIAQATWPPPPLPPDSAPYVADVEDVG
jgi:uncharacterized protein (DUF2345 family)